MLIQQTVQMYRLAAFAFWVCIAISSGSPVAVAQRALPNAAPTQTSAGEGKAKQQTWSGEITTAMCKGTRSSMGHDCILNCVKAGEKFVLNTAGRNREISNQDFAGLTEHAGHQVRLTGSVVPGGSSITVTGIQMASEKTARH